MADGSVTYAVCDRLDVVIKCISLSSGDCVVVLRSRSSADVRITALLRALAR